MSKDQLTDNLLTKIVEDSLVTKSDLIEAIYANNKELRKETKEILEKIDNNAEKMRQEMTAFRVEIRGEVHQLRQEMKTDRRWLIGLFVTAIIAIPTIFKFVELLLFHLLK